MNKWLTRFVLAVTAVVLVMMPVKSNIPDADSVSGHSLRQSDDRMARPAAAGLWQLMPETARWLGLEVDTLVDQRFDEHAATEATLDYLVALRDRPPDETRDFISRFLASVRLPGDLPVIGQAAPERDPPERFDVVWIKGAASADVLAEAAGIAEDEIRTLNPHPSTGLALADRSTRLRVAVGAGVAFLAHFARIPVGERSTLREHTVARGKPWHALRNGTMFRWTPCARSIRTWSLGACRSGPFW